MSLDAIRQIDIKEIIGNRISLKKKGSVLLAPCPFHNEKTPSFTVFQKTNTYKCFGCGASGDGLKFVMEFNRLSFLEAATTLAGEHSIIFEPKEVTPEEQKKQQELREIILVHNLAADFYHEQLQKNPEALAYANARIHAETQQEFMVGFAPPGWTVLYDHLRSLGYKEEFLLKTNLFKESEKGKIFDVFQNRLVFPVITHTGDVVGFGGRAIVDAVKPKYINSSDSDWYNKSKVLFGLRNATDAIRNNDFVNITEGYTDVTTLFTAGHKNSIALCGTALTGQHASLIARFTKNVNFLLDADKAGIKAMRRSAELLLKDGFTLTITTTLPPGKDPDDYFKQDDAEFNKQPFYVYLADTLFKDAEQDPVTRCNNIQEYAAWLILLPETMKLMMIDYAANAFRKSGVTKKALQAAIDQLTPSENGHELIELDEKSLPKYVNREEYRKYGFYESKGGKGELFAKNQYVFDKDGRVSNFIMEPLYHIKGTSDPKKLFKIVNKYGESGVIELDMDAMNSLPRFRKLIEGAGNNLFEGRDTHLMHLKRKWYDQTRYCKRIENLGWQSEGFWAWANGITTPAEEFIPVDENGIVSYGSEDYFIPAFSIIYRDQPGLFDSERRFIYVKGSMGLYEWASKFTGIYGSQSMLSIAFYLTALYSDYIFKRLGNLPILNFYGKKGTGKNEQAMSLMALFGKIQTPLQIHNTTKAGLATHMEEFVNAFFWVDEYKNSLPVEIIEGLKGIYNRSGRTRNSMKEGQKKENTLVNSMGIITGQEMLTIDIALFSRVIYLPYYKDRFTPEEENKLEDLHKCQENGLSHITARLIKHRGLVEENYLYAFNHVQSDIGERINTNQTDGRILRNITTILATFKSLEKVLDLPFTYYDLLDAAIEKILDHNALLFNSNELAQFWGIIESGVENEVLLEGKNYRIKECVKLRVVNRGSEEEKSYSPSKTVLLLKWAGVYTYYAETSRRSGQHPLPETTLLHYLETSSYFLGKVKSVRFDNEVNQARAFDYSELDMNLSRGNARILTGQIHDDDTGPDTGSQTSYEDDLPY